MLRRIPGHETATNRTMEKNAHLVASKFAHFTKCCLGEHIQANDIRVKRKMNINTLIAKGT